MATTAETLTRLEQTLRAQDIPLDGVGVRDSAQPLGADNVRMDFAPSATPAQRSQGNAIVAAFDWSVAAHMLWLTQQRRTRAGTTYAHVNELGKLFRAYTLVLLDELNLIRSRLIPPLPARTAAQVRTALTSKLDTLD